MRRLRGGGWRSWYLALAEQSHREIWGPMHGQWLARPGGWEHDNIRAVLAWALQHGEAEIAQRLAGALSPILVVPRSPERRRTGDWAERALVMPQPTSAVVRAGALGAAGRMATALGDGRIRCRSPGRIGWLSVVRLAIPTSLRPRSGG